MPRGRPPCAARPGSGAGGPSRPGAEAAFTLIELLAVVVIFALLAGLAFPNFQLLGGRAAAEEAKRLAADLELARQRAVATGVPHRLVLDVERDGWWLEWFVSEARARGESEAPAVDPFSVGPEGQVLMAPPREAEPAFRPLPGVLGRAAWLPAEVRLASVETEAGLVESGEVEIGFGRDGTAEPTSVRLVDDHGMVWRLDVAPLGDGIRIGADDA